MPPTVHTGAAVVIMMAGAAVWARWNPTLARPGTSRSQSAAKYSFSAHSAWVSVDLLRGCPCHETSPDVRARPFRPDPTEEYSLPCLTP
jgi:hypothetical protein